MTQVSSVFSYAESYTVRVPSGDSTVEDAEEMLLSPEAKAALQILNNVMAYLGSTQYGALNLDAYDLIQSVYDTF